MDNNEYSTDMVFKLKKNKKEKKLKMREIISWIVVAISVFVAIYVGLWILFVGGIAQVANSLVPIEGMSIAIGILKIVVAAPVGWLISFIGALLGIMIRK